MKHLPFLLLWCALAPLSVMAQTQANDEAGKSAPARSEYSKIRMEALPRDERGFLKPEVWDIIKEEAAVRPVSNEASILKERPIYQAYYAKYAPWTAPAPLPVSEGRLRNLSDTPTQPRFEITGKVWPARPGEAVVCLWEDDKLAAMSLGVDDNCAQDIPYWMELSKKYGGLNIIWNLITCNIDGAVTKGRIAGAGKWETWQQLVKDGYHLASHSVTHNHNPVPADGWPGPDWEAYESAHQIDSHLPGFKTKVFAYPGSGVHVFGIFGGYLPKSNWRPSLVKYYAAARGAGGDALNQANMIDYFNIHATTSAVPYLLDNSNPKFADQNLKNLFDPNHKFYRGWANVFIHFINAGKDFDTIPYNIAYAKVLEFYDKNRGEIWTGFFDDVALYGQERDTAMLKTDNFSGIKIQFTLTTKMEPTIFDYPLTVKVRLANGAKGVKATQNNKDIPAYIINHEGAPYALVKAVPDRGQVTLITH